MKMHFEIYFDKEFRTITNFLNSSLFATWLNLTYLSNASEFQCPHFIIEGSLSMSGIAAKALGRAPLNEWQKYNFASSPMCFAKKNWM
jgi:hypothetical protein